ncbi:hypothetical protein C0Q70_10760 [Pomacea canaliculata]|uniref:Uncharacterized protein n=1 Tax=Pomacea canaliculata TaxID=400727 RepID=A0A2T7P425_POMCA|nr:hypothetical protein C0Q70_10760 [Pomacea canaliculata]
MTHDLDSHGVALAAGNQDFKEPACFKRSCFAGLPLNLTVRIFLAAEVALLLRHHFSLRLQNHA